MLERAKATTETVSALNSGAKATKDMQKATNIDDVDKTIEEINEQTDSLRHTREVISAPIGANDFDEDELEAELEGTELEQELLQPATTTPVALVYATGGKQPTRPAAQRDPDEYELAELQREMAL